MGVKCFQVVQGVLDATYAAVPDTSGSRDAKIRGAIEAMSRQYRTALITSGGPDFSDPATRFGYVLAYVPAHAHWLFELIGWSLDAQALFNRPKLRVACLGGGPGSDLVGILKYMDESGKSPRIFCEIVDGCIEWKTTWGDLAFSLDWENALHTDYVIHNLADPGTWIAPSAIEKADLVTLSFFVSEVFHLGNSARDYLIKVLSSLKPGAVVLVNDNNAYTFYNWFDQITASAGLQTILSSSGTRKIYDGGEQTADLGDYATRFKRSARLTGELCWRVLRKPENRA